VYIVKMSSPDARSGYWSLVRSPFRRVTGLTVVVADVGLGTVSKREDGNSMHK